MITLNKAVSVRASIPGTFVTIFGYTSPSSRVELSSPKAFAVTYSDQSGYFLFDQVLLPKNPQELCLLSFDDANRSNNPVCFPEPPNNSKTDIGPILLSPTISLDLQNNFASGQSIPNSRIKIFFHEQTNQKISLIKTAHARSLPILEINTDSRGNYSINLADNSQSAYRLFSTTTFLENNSPKSNTLFYGHIYFQWFWLVLFIVFLTGFLVFFINRHRSRRRHFLPSVIYNKDIAIYV
ncbi:MAG TPA: hypothetical protein PKZ29_00995 [Candidatus Woesebacteria bacterium]|nr:hypothetical protein [Candidatus Woesebacteria bacterium]